MQVSSRTNDCFRDLQIETVRLLLKRLAKHQEFKDEEVQADISEAKNVFEIEISELHNKILLGEREKQRIE